VSNKAWFAVFDGLLELDGFVESFGAMTSANEVEELCPKRLAGDEFDLVFPFARAVIPDKEEGPNFVGNGRVTTEAGFRWTSLNGAFKDIPVLLFEGLPGTLCYLLTQSNSVSGFGIAKIPPCILASEERSVEDMCASVFDWWKCWGFGGDFGKDVEDLGYLGA